MCAFYDEKTKLWASLDRKQSEDYQLTLGQVILNWLSSHGSKVAQINDDNNAQVTYHEIWLNTIRAAQNLLKRGFKSRQRLCFMVVNNDHLLPILLASICLACPIVPLHPMLSNEEIARVLVQTKPVAIFCEANLYSKINAALSKIQFNVKLFIFGEHFHNLDSVEHLLMQTGEEVAFVPIDYEVEKDIAGIFCSSGTTGPSKCVCISYNHYIFSEPARYDSNSVVFAFDSIFWTVGVKPIFDYLYNGAVRIITSKLFSIELQLHLIEKYKVNVLYIPPFNMVPCIQNDQIHKVDLSHMKMIFLYGSKMSSTLIAEVGRFFPNACLIPWYGTTEMGRIAYQLSISEGYDDGKRLVNGCIAKIIDENGCCCGPNISGEIYVKKNNQFLGYFNDPMATAAAIDNEGFFRTADIGYFNENGILFLNDRKKNVMNIFYFDGIIFPSEIEEHLILVPDIEEVCVVGIPITTDTVLPAAVVVRKLHSNLSQRDIYNIVKEKFSNRARLRGGVYFIGSLAKTHNGKLLRREITRLAEQFFEIALKDDADVQASLSVVPDEYRKLIDAKYNR